MGACCSVTLCEVKFEAAQFSRCVDCTFTPATSVCMMKSNLSALIAASQQLQGLNRDVHENVQMAELESKRLNQVEVWMSAVEKEAGEVDKLVQKISVGGSCCSRSCKFGRKVSKKLKVVNALIISRGDFAEVAGMGPAPAVHQPAEPTLGTQSEIEKLIWSQLEKKEVGIVGLFGMGGVGKTTLLNHIHNKYLETQNDYDVIIYVTVSRNHKTENVQDDIRRKLGSFHEDWKNKERQQKTADIFRILRRQKFVLLLDDVWEPVDLKDVGVPVPDIANWSKLIFTTRNEDVCSQMSAHKRNRVECLGWKEAWNLFKNYVNIAEDILSLDPEIPELARSVAKKCAGLPLALKTVGMAMSCKRTAREWKEAVHVLSRSASQFQGMEKVLALLKFSYDNLSSIQIKHCFLYCALFPEDFVLHKDEIVYKWMCEGILNDYADVDEALNKGYGIIGTLVRACLFEDQSGHVKMHDVIREMALWLATELEETKDNFLVKSGSLLTEVPNVEKWEGVKRMSLMANDIENLDISPSCPHLLTLFLNNNRLKMISQDFFHSMSNLRVLDLSKNKDLNQLPAGVSNLVSLQYLDLSETGIRKLSIELEALVKLIYLNLEHTNELDMIPQNVISAFKKLRVLRLYNSGVCKSFLIGINEHLGKEMQSLRLEVLTLTIHSASSFKKFITSDNLVKSTQFLRLDGLSFLDMSSLARMKSPYSLTISGCESVNYDLHAFSQSPLKDLQSVVINNCPNARDLTWLIFTPNLKTLSVSSCSNMTDIIEPDKWVGVAHGDQINPFERLYELVLTHLPHLERIYGGKTLRFPFLKRIEVLDCLKLKKLPLNSSSVPNRNIVIVGEEAWWTDVKMEDDATKDSFRPFFRPHK